MSTVVFTDGACIGNPGPGGWAWAVPDGPYAAGAEVMTTNQRMEIKAVLEAAQTLDGPLEVVSDSTYVVNCFRDRWWEGWIARGWVNKAKKPVANQDLWKPLVELYRADPKRFAFRWVKGHSGDVMNDVVDRLAVEAARRQEGRSGVGVPDVLGLPDTRDTAQTEDARVPEGWRVVVGGHRPPELGGYEDNLVSSSVRAKLSEILAAKSAVSPSMVVLTGLGLGAEQLAAEAARDAGVPYVAVLPFPGQELLWPQPSQERYKELLGDADGHVLMQARGPESKQKFAGAMARRDAWLARHANEAVIVWDGADERIGKLVRSFQDHLGEEDVWVLRP